MTADALRALQGERFDEQMRLLLNQNRFVVAKYAELGFSADSPPSLDELQQLPFTTKQELLEDQVRNPPFGTNLTFPIEDYVRLHQTSGTTGHPLRWLDTAASWSWFLETWDTVLRAAGVTPADRVFCAFGFGPFIGFWGAFEAAQRMGALALTGGSLSTEERLDHLLAAEATVILGTPTYGLRLAETASRTGIDLAASPIRTAIFAGEPGASVPNVRRQLEEAWGATVYDHAGATEVGPWGFACGVESHMHVNEAEFIAEVLPISEGADRSPQDGERGELVLTNLGRHGSPVIRYRTGDLVKPGAGPCPCGRSDLYLEGGVLGRLDDMIVVRGVNVYPAAIENVIRSFPQVAEFEASVHRRRGMSEIRLRIEPKSDTDGDPSELATEVGSALKRRLSLRVEVEPAATGSLPRYELKAKRFRFDDQGRES